MSCPGTWQSSVAVGGSATVVTYAGVAEPRTLGAGGGHGCYVQTCSSTYGAGGQGGGRIYLSSAERMSFANATISADGAGGAYYSFYYSGYYYPAGGGGSGGSVLIKAPSIRGAATISADGGAPAGSSTRLSGGGAGGRIGIHVMSAIIPAAVTCSAAGGTASGSACAGSAGTIFLNSSTQTTLLIDNADANDASGTYTPLPVDGDLDGTDVSVVRNSNVQISNETAGFRARRFWIDSSSEMSGSVLHLTARNASIEGDLTGTLLARITVLTNLDVTSSARLECAGCAIDIITPVLWLAGQVDCGSLDVETDVASIEGDVTSTLLARMNSLSYLDITGSASFEGTACTTDIRAPVLRLAGQLECGSLRVTVQEHASVSGAVDATGSVTVQVQDTLNLSGAISADEFIRIRVNETLEFSGAIDAGGSVAIRVPDAPHFSGDIDAGGSVAVRVQAAMDLSGAISADDFILIRVNKTLEFTGAIDAGGSVAIQVPHAPQFSGDIDAGDSVAIRVQAAMDLSGAISVGESILIRGNQTLHISGAIDAGDDVTIQVPEALDLGDASSLEMYELVMIAHNITASGAITSQQGIDVIARQRLVTVSSSGTACTGLRCTLQLRARELLLDGPLVGGDISVISDGNMAIGASISADALGWDAEEGDGAGESVDSWTSYSSSSYYKSWQSASGSGGGHGGNGGDSCWQGACDRGYVPPPYLLSDDSGLV